MTDAEILDRLLSPASIVVVEAPAGCGKTHQVTRAALAFSELVNGGEEVLVLTHTNAAVDEIRGRLSGGAQARVLTLDAFALEVVRPWASALGFSDPLRPGSPDFDFGSLAAAVVRLLQRAPSIGRALSCHYPIALVDEHQDSSEAQHEMLKCLMRLGTKRLRIFGDPMQAIFGFGAQRAIRWEDVVRTADDSFELDEPHRWSTNKSLGLWTLAARSSLRDQGCIAAKNPPSVREFSVESPRAPLPMWSPAAPAHLVKPLHQILNACTGSIAVVTRHRAHAVGIEKALKGRTRLNEGADFALVTRAVRAVIEAEGKPRQMSLELLHFLKRTSVGLTGALTKSASDALKEDRVDPGRKRTVLPFLEFVRPIYDTPTTEVWCECARAVSRRPPQGIRVTHHESHRVLALYCRNGEEDPLEGLERAIQIRKNAGGTSSSCCSTIHKVKGRDFDTVVLATCCAETFPDEDDARRLLYVALSRARQRLAILTPRGQRSPLLG